MDIKSGVFEDVRWIQLAQNGVKLRAVFNTLMNLWVPVRRELSWLAEQLLGCQEGLGFKQLLNITDPEYHLLGCRLLLLG
jgi:hypothetical protein